MPAISSPRSYFVPAEESPDPMFWQRMAANVAFVARLAYSCGDYDYAVEAQKHAARYAATARKEYMRRCKPQ